MKKQSVIQALVCPSRSGSNFLQALMCRCTAMEQGAFYGAAPRRDALLKSHAISWMHLMNEVGSFIKGARGIPARVVVMWRHPVYATLSAYAYYRYQGNRDASDCLEFLDVDCAFYDCGLPGSTYGQRLKAFIFNWNVSSPNILHVRYEEMVADVNEILGKVCTFLSLPEPERSGQRLLEEESMRLQERWQGEAAENMIFAPFNVRQYPFEFHAPGTSPGQVKKLWGKLAPLCATLGYGKPEWGMS